MKTIYSGSMQTGEGIQGQGFQSLRSLAWNSATKACGSLGWANMYNHLIEKMSKAGMSGQEAMDTYRSQISTNFNAQHPIIHS